MTPKRIFLIHATSVAIEPINQAFARLWPEAQLANLLEDSLSQDLANAGRITDELKHRFLSLAHYAVQAGAEGILFTCSAFGDAIDLCKNQLSIPVLKPNEAMISEAIAQASRIAIVATFAPAIESITEELSQAANSAGLSLELTSFTCPEALEALRSGNALLHDQMIAELVAGIEEQDLVCFAQFSMVTAADAAKKTTALNILTTPDSAVLKLRACLES
ncbi:aspartate/glutamate racemase family protein [Pseudomonas sp. LJDD11]|uniref:aspartate/glutamate racemase family protein n=1 Tax=Pseudomonas sp. LJDD11 TaxID=2931984 RepID=UPI00211BEF90|nr:aspartate/glutamate racemase family protein [Pseudomonas sp. LJDD11]MCQ9426824.1 aspartate/glutamate racemase family protein [Pseudomonas sp. LJDD11]